MDPTTQIPSLEEISQLLSISWNATVVDHPFISGLLLIVWSYYPKVPFQAIRYGVWDLPKGLFVGFLRCLGFGEEGIRYDSHASRYQSIHYGGYIPEDSLFAHYQSYGALPLHRTGAFQDEEEESFSLWGALG